MNKFVVISVLLVIAVLLAMDGPKLTLSKHDKLKSYNTKRLNNMENSQVSVSVSDDSRKVKSKSSSPKKNYMLLDINKSEDLVEKKYKNILKEWNGIIKN